MLDHQWSEALANNNIRAVIRWLRKLTAEGDADMEEILLKFSCWTQRTSEFAKKELLTLCFSRCQGLWMFLDRSSFTRVHMLLQRLRNLLTLAKWARMQLSSAHLWHGVGVPCAVCRDTNVSSDIRRSCWSREHRALRQHIWLGQLVQWWGITGLLPKCPEANEVKRISQMWKEMDHSHQKACHETPGWEEGGTERWSSFIQSIVTQLDKQHGCMWTSEDHTDQCYPPPNLQALLQLVLVPHIDTMSVQAILMYFILDMTKFLQCKDDLLQSFCHAFTIPSSFSQQIRAFWMLDHGHVKASMELLLNPRAAAPWLSWQHHCILHCLLARKQPKLALRYLHWARPAMESVEDVKLCADVLLQNSCVSDAWTLLKRTHTESDDMVTYFLQACRGFRPCAEALKYIPVGGNDEGEIEAAGTESPLENKDDPAGGPPCPLSAKLYQAQKVNTLSPEELVRLVRNAVMEVRQPNPKISEVVWPEHAERSSTSRETFLCTEALRLLTPSPSTVDTVDKAEQTAHADKPEEEHPNSETTENISSTESAVVEDWSHESVSTFTSTSSLPLSRPYVYKSTVTLQRISSLLTDGENQSREDEEEEESGTPSPVNVTLDCSELTVTPGGATDLISLSGLNKDTPVELILSGEGREEDIKKCDSPREDNVDTSAAFMDEILHLNERLNLPSHLSCNEDNQSSLLEPQVDSHSFLSPDSEKTSDCNGASDEVVPGLLDTSALWSSAVSLDQSDCILPQIFRFCGAGTSECFLEPYGVLLQEDTAASGASAGLSSSSTIQPQIPDPLTHSTTCSIQTSSASPHTNHELSPENQLMKDEACVQSTSDHRKLGNWWKKDLETEGASCSLLAATEPSAAIESEKMSFLALSQPYSHSPVGFMDFTAKQKGDSRDVKQEDKEEPAGWKVSQGAIRSGRTWSRKGKRVKRA